MAIKTVDVNEDVVSLPYDKMRLKALPMGTRMNLATVMLLQALQYFQAVRDTPDSPYMQFLIAWSTEFLNLVWLEVLNIDISGLSALRQMLFFHLPGGPGAGDIPDLSCCQSELSAMDIRDCMIAFISLQLYTTRSRNLLVRTAACFGHHPVFIKRLESSVSQQLIALDSFNDKSGKSKSSRRIKMGLFALGGGAILAVTGGIAAPMLAYGFGAVGTALGTLGPIGAAVGGAVATTGGIIASIGVPGAVFLFGTTGASLAGWKMSKRLGCLEEFEFCPVAEATGSLEVTICISGWLDETGEQVSKQWYPDGSRALLTDNYVLKWESRYLGHLGTLLYRLIRDEIAKSIASFWLTATLGAAATTLMWPVWVLNSIGDMDNTWLVVKDRAKLSGEVLASALSDQAAIGNRPVTLIGYSMGARVIFDCMQYLYEAGNFNCIQDVVLVGSPISTTFAVQAKRDKWDRARSVVSGRLVNGYCSSDWLLGFLSRYIEWGIHVAGLSPVNEPGVEDYDLSDIVSIHTDYPSKMNEILSRMNINR